MGLISSVLIAFLTGMAQQTGSEMVRNINYHEALCFPFKEYQPLNSEEYIHIKTRIIISTIKIKDIAREEGYIPTFSTWHPINKIVLYVMVIPFAPWLLFIPTGILIYIGTKRYRCKTFLYRKRINWYTIFDVKLMASPEERKMNKKKGWIYIGLGVLLIPLSIIFYALIGLMIT